MKENCQFHAEKTLRNFFKQNLIIKIPQKFNFEKILYIG